MDGTLLIDKPPGLTSHDVVVKVRRVICEKRAGHAGTLDPFATGLLIVCAGKATRLVQYLIGLDKEYLAVVRVGFATDTQDLTGKQIAPLVTSNDVTAARLEEVLSGFVGAQMQTPPMFSAKQIAGKRLYLSARAGEEVERAPVGITVHSIDLIPQDGMLSASGSGVTEFTIRVRCSSGTYVRTLAHDIGRKLGTGAHLGGLRRTGIGQFKLSNAVTLDRLETCARNGELSGTTLTPSDTVAHLPAVKLDDAQVKAVSHGREVTVGAQGASQLADGQSIRLCGEDGLLLAVGEYDTRTRTIRPRVVLSAAEGAQSPRGA